MQDPRLRRWHWWQRLAQTRIYVRDLYQYTSWSSQANATSSGNSGQEVVRTAHGTCTWMPSDCRIAIANNAKILLDKLSVVFYPWVPDQDLQRHYRHGKIPQQVRSLLLSQGNPLFQ